MVTKISLSMIAQNVLSQEISQGDNIIIVPIDEPYCCVGAPYECYKKDISRIIRQVGLGFTITVAIVICAIDATILFSEKTSQRTTFEISLIIMGIIEVLLLLVYAMIISIQTTQFLSSDVQESVFTRLTHTNETLRVSTTIHRAFNTSRRAMQTARIMIFNLRLTRLCLITVVFTSCLSVFQLAVSAMISNALWDKRPLTTSQLTGLLGMNVASIIFSAIMFVIVSFSAYEIHFAYTKLELQIFSFGKGLATHFIFLSCCLLAQIINGNFISKEISLQ